MSSDPKKVSASTQRGPRVDVQGIRIFTYPKVIFMFPTLIVALICGVGMVMNGNRTEGQRHAEDQVHVAQATGHAVAEPAPSTEPKHDRFKKPENLLGVLFLGVFAFNLLIMALDFPRFTIIAVGLLIGFVVFFTLWIGAYFDYELMRAVRMLMSGIYLNANAAFYFMVAAVLSVILTIVYITRWLDYWMILPNEILHHHGPLSDLERFPTMNLKFDKEIPDVLEFAFLGSGRLVLHVTDERKSIVLKTTSTLHHLGRSRGSRT